MLASCATEPFDSKDHLFELKWDGIRCLAFVDEGQLRLQSRGLNDIIAIFPELLASANFLRARFWTASS